jgi:L-amino acid N-acyltransferase YncA
LASISALTHEENTDNKFIPLLSRESLRTISLQQAKKVKIRMKPLTEHNRKEVIDIFNYYIENSFAAYPENKVPYEFFDALLKMCERYPSLIAEDESGTILGFGMLRAYNSFSTFSQTAEITYFIRPECTDKGIGRMMLDCLTDKAREKGITSILASICSLNNGSINFHKKNGFIECGRLREIGRKKGKTFDVVYMQKML